MPDLSRYAHRAIVTASRLARHLPGRAGGMGTYFTTQRRLTQAPTGIDWPTTVDQLLALADRSLARGRIDAALRWFDKALRISYHPSLHQAGASPLAAAPTEFLRPLRSSAVGQIMLGGRVAPATVPSRPPARAREAGRPVRLLVIAQENWTFIHPIIEALQAEKDHEVRQLDVDDLTAPGFASRDQILRGRYDAVTTGRLMPTPPELAAAYDWADVVLVEWSHHVLTWVTLLDTRPRVLASRLHRFEVFTPFPLLHDHQRIDRLLYVSPPVHTMLTQVAPALAEVPATRVGNLLTRGLGPTPADHHDRHLLVQVGWVREVKDVLFSLDVLETLRARDPRFRLRLIGPGLPADPDADTPYQRTVRRRLRDVGSEAVELLGARDDVPALLAESGFIVSTSRHEGTHESVMEGLAAGCVAVIRDWPDTVGYGGAAAVYDSRWVVADVGSAVHRVRELQDPLRWHEASQDARAFVLEERDPGDVISGYAHALRPAPAQT